MIRFEKPKKKLGGFLKDEKNTFAKKKLIKTGLAIGAAVIGINLLLDNAVLAASSHSNVDVSSVQFVPVATNPKCSRLTPTHTQHSSHSNSHSSY